ncbi:MAG: DUF3304 domain-containing protein [Cupriavidus necator]
MSALRWPKKMPKSDGLAEKRGRFIDSRHIAMRFRMTSRALVALVMLAVVAALPACTERTAVPAEARDASVPADQNVVNPGGVSGLNYTPYYIAGFGISGENGMSGGGPNIMPATDERPAGGGKETCCIGIPEVWQPGMKITIRWEVDKVMDGKAETVHYKAFGEIPQYARATYGFWAIFLPGDRVKAMVMDGNSTGQNSVWKRPPDDDPYVTQGVVDEEANHEAAERLCKYPVLPTDCPGGRTK